MPEAAVILGAAVTTVITALLIDFLKRGGEAWWWQKLAPSVRRVRSRYQGWREEKRKKRVEAGLDKVEELLSRKEELRAEFWEWPDDLTRLWYEAAAQLIKREVNWDVGFSEHGARVSYERNRLHVKWEDFKINGLPNIRSGVVTTDTGAALEPDTA